MTAVIKKLRLLYRSPLPTGDLESPATGATCSQRLCAGSMLCCASSPARGSPWDPAAAKHDRDNWMKLFSRFDEDGDDFLNETELRKLAALIYPKTIGVDSTDHWNKVAWEFWCNFVGGANPSQG